MKSVYQIILERIIGQLKEGVIPWKQPWFSIDKRNIRGNVYKGINRLLLAGEKDIVYLSWKQIKEREASVKKDGRSNIVVLTKPIDKKKENNPESVNSSGNNIDEEVKYDTIWFMRYYKVWGASKIEGLPQSILDELKSEAVHYPPIDRFIINSGARIIQGGMPGYSVDDDTIIMPPIESFRKTEDYYASIINRLVQWTGHPKRLNRFCINTNTDTEEITEELIGELGSAFFCNIYKLNDYVSMHSSYIDYWIKTLENKSTTLFIAAALSEKACNYLMETCLESREIQCEST